MKSLFLCFIAFLGFVTAYIVSESLWAYSLNYYIHQREYDPSRLSFFWNLERNVGSPVNMTPKKYRERREVFFRLMKDFDFKRDCLTHAQWYQRAGDEHMSADQKAQQGVSCKYNNDYANQVYYDNSWMSHDGKWLCLPQEQRVSKNKFLPEKTWSFHQEF